MQANWALVQWFPGLDEFPCELKVVFWFTPLGLLIHPNNGKAPEGAEESLRTTEILHQLTVGTQLGNALKEMDVNDVVQSCSSLPGAAERCPHSGLCDLKAHS